MKSDGLDTFFLCVYCDFDLGDMTGDQGHDTPLGYKQPPCVLSKSKMPVKSYSPDMAFGYMYTLT